MRLRHLLTWLFLSLMGLTLVSTFTACSSEDEDNLLNNNETVIEIDEKGNAKGDHIFSVIDESNFYIDDIKYTAQQGELSVTGWNETFFKGEAKIVSMLKYQGRKLKVTSIGSAAFQENQELTSVIIPTSITRIDNSAFRDCKKLSSFTITTDSMKIGDYAFSGCSGLKTISFYCRIVGDYFKRFTHLQEIIIGDEVEKIKDGAFYGCTGLRTITIPNNVNSIGGQAFYGCSSLESIKVESGNKVYDSRDNCNAIIETKSNTLIAGCKNTIIPNSVTSIGAAVFCYCSGLTSVTIPKSVTSIGDYAFWNCSGLTSIKVESGNQFYDSRDNCNAIIETKSNTLILGCNNTIIPNSVSNIGVQAFYSCTGLTSIVIPEGVTKISDYAFRGCGCLKDVYCYAKNVPVTDSSPFDDYTISQGTLHVPASAIDAYKSKWPWSNFRNIVAIE